MLRSLLDDSLTLQTNSQESPSLIEPNVDQNNDQNINLNPTSSHNQIKSPDREVPKVSGSENSMFLILLLKLF